MYVSKIWWITVILNDVFAAVGLDMCLSFKCLCTVFDTIVSF